jgi:hypothetical protein
MRSVDPRLIEQASRWLGDAAVDPAVWPVVMDEICQAAGATGSLLLQSDIRTPDIPITASLAEQVVPYFRDGWHMRDDRASRGVARVLRGEIIADQDLFTPDELRRAPYFNECIYAMGLRWFAGIGFWAGSASWALSLQRTAQDGPFEPDDKRPLAELSPRLTEAATLSTAAGRCWRA